MTGVTFLAIVVAAVIATRLWQGRRRIAPVSWVYLVEDVTRAGVYKIGWSARWPTERMAEIRRGSRRPVRLVCAGPGSRGLERYLQAKYPKVAAVGMEGHTEWRRLTSLDVVDVTRILTGR